MSAVWWIAYGFAAVNVLVAVVMALLPLGPNDGGNAKHLRLLRYKTVILGILIAMLGYPWGTFPGLVRLLEVDPLLYFTCCGAYMSLIAPLVVMERRAARWS